MVLNKVHSITPLTTIEKPRMRGQLESLDLVTKSIKPLFPKRSEEGKSVGKLSLPSIGSKGEEIANRNSQL
jgi:hypothetical protein